MFNLKHFVEDVSYWLRVNGMPEHQIASLLTSRHWIQQVGKRDAHAAARKLIRLHMKR